MRRAWSILRVPLGSVLSIGLAFSFAPSTEASAPRVPADYFAVDFDFNHYGFDPDAQAQLEHVLGKLAASGINHVRGTFEWGELEPAPPSGGTHRYVFDNFDRWVTAAARNGIRIQANFGYTPSWATDSNWCTSVFGAHSARPVDLVSWRLAVDAFAKRYGRGGTFWAQHPGLDARPITSFEIWNEQNLHWYWCPAPQPEIYASYLNTAERAIAGNDPNADVIFGGMTLTSGTSSAVTPGDFLKRTLGTVPGLRQTIDGVGIHPYAFGDRAHELEAIRLFREEMRAGTATDSMPMIVTEVGWPLRGSVSFPEDERAERFRLAATQIPRTNCNVSGLTAYTWISREQQSSNFDDWFGLAAPGTGDLYLSGATYAASARLMRGELASEPARAALMICAGMPRPDQDRDGTPDENDDFPLDPTRTDAGQPPEPPGDGDPGDPPDGSGSAGHGSCTERLAALTERIAAAQGSRQRTLKRKYRSVERRCVPCKRRLGRLKRKIQESEGAGRQRLRAQHRRVRRRCAPCIRKLHALQIATLGATQTERALYLRRHERARKRCTGRRR